MSASTEEIIESVHLPPNIDPLKATLAYGNGALGRLVYFIKMIFRIWYVYYVLIKNVMISYFRV